MQTLLAFTPDQTCRVTGLSRWQLAYWDRTGFFRPHFRDDRSSQFNRMYSFRDVVGLRTVSRLREQLPLQELRRIGAWLLERYDQPWSTLKFYVVGRRVEFDDELGQRWEAGSGQGVLLVELREVEAETMHAARALTARRADDIGQVGRHRTVQHNAWVMQGTRIPTAAIWAFHEAGYDTDQIIAEYSRLQPQDVVEAIRFERARRSTG